MGLGFRGLGSGNLSYEGLGGILLGGTVTSGP